MEKNTTKIENKRKDIFAIIEDAYRFLKGPKETTDKIMNLLMEEK